VSAASKHTALAAASVALIVALAFAGLAGGARGGKRDKVPPTAPTNVRLTGATPFSVSLALDAATDDVGVAGYYVYVDGMRTRISGTSYTAQGLECGQSVNVWVIAFDGSNNRSPAASATVSTAPCPDLQPPTTPGGFQQQATTQNAVVLAWDPSSDNVGVVGYGVYRNLLPVANTSDPSVTLSGMTCGSAYQYTVDAVDAAGNRSPRGSAWVQTAGCSDGEAPTAPSGLTVTSHTADSLGLSWTASSDNVAVAGYRVSLGSAVVATVTETNASLSNLPCGMKYTVSVDAFDAAGNRSPAALTSAATDDCPAPAPPPPGPTSDTSPPTTPSNLAVVSATQTSAALSWLPSTDDVGVVGFDVYLNGNSNSTSSLPAATVSGLTSGTADTFEVDAYDPAGNHSARTSVTGSTAACSAPAPPPPSPDTTPPTTPTSLAVAGVTRTSVSLTWSPSTDDVAVAGYGVYVGGASVSSTSVPGATVSNLTCGTAYMFEVDAFDAAGNRSSRAQVTSSTSACADTQPPTAPANVNTTSRTATSIALSWSASTDNVGVVGYTLYRGGSQVGTVSSTTGIFSGLACNTSYTLAVDAYDAAGNHSTKTAVMVSTTACPDTTPPSVPTGLATSNVTQTGMTLSWSASSDNVGVAGYDLSANGSKVGSTTNTNYPFGSLTCGTSYTLGVVAYDAAGNRSNQASATASTSACTSSSPPPPSGNALRWSPPGYDGSGDPRDPVNYPGYKVVDAPTTYGALSLDDNTDYFVKLGNAQWSSISSGRSSISINGGRNVVIIGGSINFTATNNLDDESALIINDGNSNGIVHIEGVNIKSVNGITIRTQRTVQIENVRIEVRAWHDDYSTGIHPDLVQVWDRGPSKIRQHRFTGYSPYSGIPTLLQDPAYWYRYDVDIHAVAKLTGGLPDINPVQYLGAKTEYVGDNLWAETGYYSSTVRRKLDDVLIGYAATGTQTQMATPYEISGVDGESYVSPASPTGGNAPYPLGSRQGDRITFARNSLINEAWTQGKPPASAGADANGNFVPASLVGTGYVSPGYQ
jgi:chitodextrinase